MNGHKEMPTIECGAQAAKEFALQEGWQNLNHGSFGTAPKAIRAVAQQHQNDSEMRPDAWIRYDYPKLLDKSREALATYLNVPLSTIALIPNATTGMNTVLSNLIYSRGDTIIYFSTIYGACEKIIEYLMETTAVASHKITYTQPISDAALLSLFESAITSLRAQGKKPRVAVFDTISSMPGVRLPFEALTRLCKQHNILSAIDGAHGIGQIPLDLAALDPDFFFSNCHKWLYTPRSCAVFYVPERNQHLVRTTLPTSHGFVPVPREGSLVANPLPPTGKSEFVTQFEFVGTLENSAYLCVPAALEWRSRITYGEKMGEEAIMSYCQTLARSAGRIVSEILGTEVMENAEGTLGECFFSNVRLPLSYAERAGGEYGKAMEIALWIAETQVREHGTFIPLMIHGDAWWVRLSAQVYLTEDDFRWGGEVLRGLCERAVKGEWKQGGGKESKL